MKLLNLLIIIGLICLTACVQNNGNSFVFSNDTIGYSIIIPKIYEESGTWLDSSSNESGPSFGTKVDRSIDPPFGMRDKNINIFHRSSCPKIGVMNTINVNAGKWGRVDFWDNRYDGMDIQNEYPFCRPPSKGNTYAFCAEKDGKAVAICIQQMTDDEAMAKQIFESFRWTD